MQSTLLSAPWTVTHSATNIGYPRSDVVIVGTLPATVPGHVHLDLVAAGLLADPFRERFEASCQWVDLSDWTYSHTFEWRPTPGLPRRVLRFEGLDTIATVRLNGAVIGHSDNMFVPLEIDVTDTLAPGTNLLEVHLESPVRVGEERRRAYFQQEGLPWTTARFDERAFVRKAGYMSGWDWGPRLVSCGIWQPVRLLEFAGRIRQCSVLQQPLGGGKFKLQVVTDVEGNGDLEVLYNGDRVESEWECQDPLWWPNGEGEQHLNRVDIQLSTGHTVTKHIGLRTIELVQAPDEIGRSFEFVVNGRKLWARGANWIPNDSFPSRITAEDVHRQIHHYASLKMNMLRVWGGGFYESDAFYDACDLHGLLVWQDFPYACSYYPDGPAEQDVAEREATDNILRLRDRASLALWCGNNENRSMWASKWGGLEASPPRLYGDQIYDHLLPRLIQELDPQRRYIESSPQVAEGTLPVAKGQEPRYSDDHFWDVWHGRGDWRHYADSQARFCSEFGFASACLPQTWKAISDRDLAVDDPTVLWHDKTHKGWETFKGYVALHYPEPRSLEEWTYQSQMNQRDAMRTALEHYRSNPGCRGALIWQINDCWPVQSWAMEDYSRLFKAAGFELSRIFASVLLAAKVEEGNLRITVINDGAQPLADTLAIDWFSIPDGLPLGSHRVDVAVPASDKLSVLVTPPAAVQNRSVLQRITLVGEESATRWSLNVEPNDVSLSPQDLHVEVGEHGLEVTCPGLVYDLVVWDDADGHNLIDGETGLSGWRPTTGIDLRFEILASRRPVALRARSLAGEHRVVIAMPKAPRER